MITTYPLLKILADGQAHEASTLQRALDEIGCNLAEQLALIDSMRLGVIKSQHGYRLKMPLDLLDECVLRQSLDTAVDHVSTLEIALSCDSTNRVLIHRSRDFRIHGSALFAEQQTQGRGRLGRAWVSPFGHNIYLSLGWHFANGARALQGLSLAVGVAVADAIKACTGLDAQLKWPNDIYLEGKKCGGILIDMTGDPAGDTAVVIGVGLNVGMPVDQAAEIDQPWCDIRAVASQPVSRSELAGRLLAELVTLAMDYERTGFMSWHARWSERDYLLGKPVAIDSLVKVEGVGAGINDEGALLIRTSAGLEAVFGGEATLRKSERL